MALTTRPTNESERERKEREEREREQRDRDPRDRDPRRNERREDAQDRREREEHERKERQDHERERERGQQRSTLPGSTDKTSQQMPKPGESSDKGKGPLKFDPNAPAVDTVAQRGQMQVEGKLDYGKRPEDQIHSSQIPPERDPEKSWEEQARYAINGLYPRLREGVDWAIGRKTIDGDLELLEGEKAGVDWGKVQEAAKKLAGNDPYTTYKPKKGIGQPRDEGYDLGERHKEYPNRELPPNVAQSEVNPKSNEKVPSQAYPTNPPRTSQGAPISEDDPNFNEDGTRKLPPPEGYDEEE